MKTNKQISPPSRPKKPDPTPEKVEKEKIVDAEDDYVDEETEEIQESDEKPDEKPDGKIDPEQQIMMEIELLQNNGRYRVELLHQLQEINKALVVVAGVLVDLSEKNEQK